MQVRCHSPQWGLLPALVLAMCAFAAPASAQPRGKADKGGAAHAPTRSRTRRQDRRRPEGREADDRQERQREGQELRLQRPRSQRSDAHAAAPVLPRARERRARAREPREALVHPAHGEVRRGRGTVTKTVALRTALIWRDEVMDDVVLEKPTKITVGHVGKPTFIVPDIGLPKELRDRPSRAIAAICSRSASTCAARSASTAKRQHVAEFVRAATSAELVGGFRAHADQRQGLGRRRSRRSGEYKLFFQFVPLEDEQPFFTPAGDRGRRRRLRAGDRSCSPAVLRAAGDPATRCSAPTR